MSNIKFLLVLIASCIMQMCFCAENSLPLNQNLEAGIQDLESGIRERHRNARKELRYLIALSMPLIFMGGVELVSYFVNSDDPTTQQTKIGNTIAMGIISPASGIAAYLLHKNARRLEAGWRVFSTLEMGRDIALATACSTAMFACAPWAPYSASIALRLSGSYIAIGTGITKLYDSCIKLHEINSINTE